MYHLTIIRETVAVGSGDCRDIRAWLADDKTAAAIPRRDQRSRSILLGEKIEQLIARQRRMEDEIIIVPARKNIGVSLVAYQTQHRECLQIMGQRRRRTAG